MARVNVFLLIGLVTFACVVADNIENSSYSAPVGPVEINTTSSSTTPATSSSTTAKTASTTNSTPVTTTPVTTTPIAPTASPTKVTNATTKPTPTTTPTASTKPTPTTTPTASTKPTPSTTPTTPSTKPTSPTKPTPTTTPTPPTTKPTSTPAPLQPDVVTWYVNFTDTNQSCIIVKAAIQIQLDDHNSTVLSVPKTANLAGSCNITSPWLALQWGSNDLALHFHNDSKHFDVNSITVNLYPSNQSYHLIHSKEEFATGLKNSYKCDKVQRLALNDEQNTNKTLAHIVVSHLQIQAFQNTTGTFNEAVDCLSGGTPDVVPIAVGCALAGLVLIMFVSYLWGRRRFQARGYLSMFAETRREEDYIPMKNMSCFN